MGISSYLEPINEKVQATWQNTTTAISNSRAWNKAVEVKNQLAAKAMEKATAVWQKIETTEIWRNKINPFYEGYVKPGVAGVKSLKDKVVTTLKDIHKRDAQTLGGGLIISITITSIAIATFGIIVLPLAVMSGTGTMLVSTYNVHERVRRERNEKAWGRLDRLRRHIHVLTYNNQKVDPIYHQLKKLQLQSDFKHLQDDIKQIKTGFDSVSKVLQKPNFEEYQTSLLQHLTELKTLFTGRLPPDHPIWARINAFEANIKNAGKQNYVRKEATKFLMDLNKVSLPNRGGALTEIRTDLKREFVRLDNTLAKHRIREAKDNYNAQIETLMRKLVPDWDIEKLGPGHIIAPDEEEAREIQTEAPAPRSNPEPIPTPAPESEPTSIPEDEEGLNVELQRINNDEDPGLEIAVEQTR